MGNKDSIFICLHISEKIVPANENDQKFDQEVNDNRAALLALEMLSHFGICIFEFCVGIYFPTIGSIKAAVVQESTRTTTYLLFHMPMNILICIVICSKLLPGTVTKLGLCVGLLLAGSMGMSLFSYLDSEAKDEKKESMGSSDKLEIEDEDESKPLL